MYRHYSIHRTVSTRFSLLGDICLEVGVGELPLGIDPLHRR